MLWQRVSDIGSMPHYWHGHKSIELSGITDGRCEVLIRFAFGGRGRASVEIDDRNMEVRLTYSSGPFTGLQTVRVGDGELTASWDIAFRGIYRLVAAFGVEHFRTGTAHALERLRDSAR